MGGGGGGGGGAVAPLVPIPLSCVQPLLLENAHYVTCAEPQRPLSLPKPPPPGIITILRYAS